MTDEELADIKERVEAATSEPWAYEDGYLVAAVNNGADHFLGNHDPGADDFRFDADGVFIAHAREDIPALLAEVERMREIVRVVADLDEAQALESGDTFKLFHLRAQARAILGSDATSS